LGNGLFISRNTLRFEKNKIFNYMIKNKKLINLSIG
jgi:hypothetical protein